MLHDVLELAHAAATVLARVRNWCDPSARIELRRRCRKVHRAPALPRQPPLARADEPLQVLAHTPRPARPEEEVALPTLVWCTERGVKGCCAVAISD